MVKVLSLFSGSLASRVATRLVWEHPQVDGVHLLHFRSPFSRDCEELRPLVKAEWAGATYRTQSIKKDYQDLIGLTDESEFSSTESCRRCQSLLLSKAARYMERIGAEYIVAGHAPKGCGLSARDLATVAALEGLEGRVLSLLPAHPEEHGLTERPLRSPANIESWGDVDRQTREASEDDDRIPRLAERLGLGTFDPASSRFRCKLTTPGFGERVAALFKEKVVTLNALCLLDFPMYMKASPDLHIVLAFDENEKRELQNYFLPQDLRLYPATPHGPMTLLRTNWDAKSEAETDRIVEFVARLTATYACVADVTTVPVYYRMESEDERRLMNVEPFTSIEELEARNDLELIPLELPLQRVFTA